MKIGIPKVLNYYCLKKWIYFFEELGIEVVYYDMNRKIMGLNDKICENKMYLSFKFFERHTEYLKDKCDYILIPNLKYQKCTNFRNLYDLCNNLSNGNIIMFDNIDKLKYFIKIGDKLSFKRSEIKKAYLKASIKYNKQLKKLRIDNINNLTSNHKKILLVSNYYNDSDKYISAMIKLFDKHNIKTIYEDLLNENCSKKKYFKNNKIDLLNVNEYTKNVDGIVFFDKIPCVLDNLINELMIDKTDKPYLNLSVNDEESLSKVEEKIENFISLINNN